MKQLIMQSLNYEMGRESKVRCVVLCLCTCNRAGGGGAVEEGEKNRKRPVF